MLNLPRIASFVLLVGMMPGCGPRTALDRAGVAISLREPWRAENRAKWMVPGTPLAAWSGPDGSSLVAYQTLWVPGGSAEMLVEAMGNRLESPPASKVLVKRVETVAGVPAARVEVVAPGTGDALAPSGLGTPIEPTGKSLIPTRQVTLAFARPSGTIYLTWHVPEASYARIEPDIRTAIDSLRFH